jgi:hypothetical protein
LDCSTNQLTSLDITQNTVLSSLGCGSNQLTNLNITQHTSLEGLFCENNLLTSLDVTQNTLLSIFFCYNNLLTSLDVRNGNNANFVMFQAYLNVGLNCIYVDNKNATYLSSWNKDASTFWANDSLDCQMIISVDEYSLENSLSVYPNPTSNQLSIDTELEINEITIIDITGKLIKTTKQNTSTINVADLSNGIYFIKIITDKGTLTKKFVKQ